MKTRNEDLEQKKTTHNLRNRPLLTEVAAVRIEEESVSDNNDSFLNHENGKRALN